MTNKNFQSGDLVVCTISTSPGYKEGKTYKVYTNPKGQLCLIGEDGYEDLISMLVSSFRKVS